MSFFKNPFGSDNKTAEEPTKSAVESADFSRVISLHRELADHFVSVGNAIAKDIDANRQDKEMRWIAGLDGGRVAKIQQSHPEGEAQLLGCAEGDFGNMMKQRFNPSIMERIFYFNGGMSLLGSALQNALSKKPQESTVEDAASAYVFKTVDETLAGCVLFMRQFRYNQKFVEAGLHITALTGGPNMEKAPDAINKIIESIQMETKNLAARWADYVFNKEFYLSVINGRKLDIMPLTVGKNLQEDSGKVMNGVWLDSPMHEAMVQHLAKLQADGIRSSHNN